MGSRRSWEIAAGAGLSAETPPRLYSELLDRGGAEGVGRAGLPTDLPTSLPRASTAGATGADGRRYWHNRNGLVWQT